MSNKKEAILIIDDSPLICKMVELTFQSSDMQVFCAYNKAEALHILLTESCDIILLDAVLPDADGVSLCQVFKKDPQIKDIPVIFITSMTDTKYMEAGFQAGATDYIAKPFTIIELKARVLAHLQAKRNNDLLKQINVYLEQAIKENQRLANTDPLTGVYNRFYFNKQLNSQIKLAKVRSLPLALCFCDVDDFKKINDTYGHSIGDVVLTTITHFIRRHLPSHANVARWGGEEFAIILPETTVEEGYFLVETIRNAIAHYRFDIKGKQFHSSLTISLIAYDHRYDLDTHMYQLDQALYEGKNSGKNCTVLAAIPARC